MSKYFPRKSMISQARHSRNAFRIGLGSTFARPLRVELLEDRRMLATFTVSSLSDVSNQTDGQLTLREAIFVANVVPGPDTIEFAAALTSGGPATITLNNGELMISDSLTISGSGANLLTIDASGNDPTPNMNNGDGSRVLKVATPFISGTVAISGLTLTGGDTNVDGGGILNYGYLSIIDSIIRDNHAFWGGGLVNFGDAELSRTTIQDNTATDGGGVFNSEQCSLFIHESTIANNHATNSGGGLLNRYNADISNSTFSGNRSINGFGGGIYTDTGHLFVDRSTITNNTALSGQGAGIYSAGDNLAEAPPMVSIGGSVIAGNFGGDMHDAVEHGGSNPSHGFNLFGVGDALFTELGDQTGVLNPGLGPLADNGGPTFTHALLADSPAIDAGDPMAMPGFEGFDQRGAPFDRVYNGDGVDGARIDIGAYEFNSTLFLVVDTLVDESDGDYFPGDFSLREAIELANLHSIGPDGIGFDAALRGGTILLTLGQLNITGSLWFYGPGATLLTIDASGNDPTPIVNDGNGSRVFNVDDGDTNTSNPVGISGLTITGGDIFGDGGGIRSLEDLTVVDSVITGNSAGDRFDHGSGGGIFAAGEDLTVVNSKITGNTATFGGGLFC